MKKLIGMMVEWAGKTVVYLLVLGVICSGLMGVWRVCSSLLFSENKASAKIQINRELCSEPGSPARNILKIHLMVLPFDSKKENLEIKKKLTEICRKIGPIKQVNINTETKPLKTLANIGTKKAKNIAKHRKNHTPFQRPRDIMKVDGVGVKTFIKNRYRVCTEEKPRDYRVKRTVQYLMWLNQPLNNSTNSPEEVIEKYCNLLKEENPEIQK